jgi:hypothetical protein
MRAVVQLVNMFLFSSNCQVSELMPNVSAISWQEHVTFDEMMISILNQHA